MTGRDWHKCRTAKVRSRWLDQVARSASSKWVDPLGRSTSINTIQLKLKIIKFQKSISIQLSQSFFLSRRLAPMSISLCGKKKVNKKVSSEVFSNICDPPTAGEVFSWPEKADIWNSIDSWFGNEKTVTFFLILALSALLYQRTCVLPLTPKYFLVVLSSGCHH